MNNLKVGKGKSSITKKKTIKYNIIIIIMIMIIIIIIKIIIIIIIIIINTFLYGAFTKLNAPYNDLQTAEDKIPILWGIFFLSKLIIFLDGITVREFEFTVKPDQAQPPRFY